MARFWKLAQDLRSSYWFLPSLLVLCALVLAQITIWLDRHTDAIPFGLTGLLPDTQTDGARAVLSVISQSVIGVTGVMFSITMVAVSFASSNFGPRLIGNFMRDRGNQWCLGILISIFVYTLIILRAVQSSEAGEVDVFVPQLSVMVSLGLAIVAVAAMIYFIHHVPETINVGNITASLGRRLDNGVRDRIDAIDPNAPEPAPQPGTKPAAVVCPKRAGYIQTMNTSGLRDLAEEHGWFLKVDQGPGQFVDHFTPVLSVWSPDPPKAEELSKLRACFAIGDSRTEHQNLYFIADQLVEMAARALSPGVNDPYTAISCLNWLRAAVASALVYNGGLKEWRSGRVDYERATFGGLFAIAFGRIGPYCATDPLALEHVVKCLDSLESLARTPDEAAIIVTVRRQILSVGADTATLIESDA